MYINKVTLYGNLTRDPELKSLPSGMHVSSFSVATNRSTKDASGAKKDVTEYHNIVAFGKQAEVINQYLKKGSAVYVEGRMQTRSWDGQDGKKQYRTEVVLESFQFGPRGSGNSSGSHEAKDIPGSDDSGPMPGESKSDDGVKYPDEDINPEDIPF